MTEDQKRRAARHQALRYRIWAFCEPRGWNVTVHEIAEELEVSWQSAHHFIRHAGWLGRIRVVSEGDGAVGFRRFGGAPSMDSSFSEGAMLAADIRRETHGEA